MYPENQITPPLLFNPLKHHLGFIKEYIQNNLKDEKSFDNLVSYKRPQTPGWFIDGRLFRVFISG